MMYYILLIQCFFCVLFCLFFFAFFLEGLDSASSMNHYLLNMLKHNLKTFDHGLIKDKFMKIIENSSFDDQVTRVIVQSLKTSNCLKNVLLDALTKNNINPDNFFEIFKVCISKFESDTQSELLNLLVEETKPKCGPRKLEDILKGPQTN